MRRHCVIVESSEEEDGTESLLVSHSTQEATPKPTTVVSTGL